MSPTACWYFGRLAPGIGTGTGSSVNPHCPSLRPPLPLQVFCNFPRRLCYLRGGELCQASNSDTDSTSPLPLCQHDDSAAPAGFFSLPPPSLPASLSSSLLPLTSLIHHAHQTKQIFFFFSLPQPDSETQNRISKHPSRPRVWCTNSL